MTGIGIVDTDVGPLIAPIDPWIWPCLVDTGQWEPDVGAVVRDVVRGGDTVVNVGAHVGYYTRMAALAGAHVIAYEPAPSNRRLLELNTVGLDVEIRHHAVSDTNRAGQLNLSTCNPGDHHLGPHTESVRSIDTTIVALDSELFAPFDSLTLVIVDAQGEDLRVLRGAHKFIDLFRPHLLIEFTPHLLDPADYPEIDRLIAAGYTASLIEPGHFPVTSGAHAADVLGAGTATMHLAPGDTP